MEFFVIGKSIFKETKKLQPIMIQAFMKIEYYKYDQFVNIKNKK
ncbi:hypothetical protein [Clostridium sp. YIM B02555]|nr:hypothetical protein [Clostridium sp. YIM B02555]